MKHYCLAFALSLLACSCNVDSDDVSVIGTDVSEGLQKVSVTDICESVEVIPVQGDMINSSGVIRSDCIAVTDTRIYFFDDYSRTLFALGHNGEMFQSSCKLGRGPGEILAAYDILVNERRNTLDVLDAMGAVYRYSLEDLSFVEELKFPLGAAQAYHSFALVDDGYLLFSDSGENHLLHYNESTGKMTAFNLDYPDWYYSEFPFERNTFCSVDGEVCFYESLDGTILSIDTEKRVLRKKYKWNLGNKTLSFKQIPKKMSQMEYYEEFIMGGQTKNYITPFFFLNAFDGAFLADVFYDSRTCCLLYRKSDGKSFFFDKTTEGITVNIGASRGNTLYSICGADFIGNFFPEEYYKDSPADLYLIKYNLRN